MPRINIIEPGQTGQPYRFDLKRMQVTIGRSSSCHIPIKHRSVSKHHCSIERRKGGFVVTDNDSTNGIKLDEERLDEITLTNGMEFEIGDVTAVFTLTDEECDHLTQERFKPRNEEEETVAEEGE